MLSDRDFASRVLADLCVARAFQGGKLGIFAENVPNIDVPTFIEGVRDVAPSKVRIALLGGSQRLGKSTDQVELTSEPGIANQWRNDSAARSGRPSIVMVLGPAPKLNSLRTALPQLRPHEVRKDVIERCIRALDTPERRALLSAIALERGHIPLNALMAYASEVSRAAQKGKAILMEAEPKLVRLLGLLPSPSLHQATGPAAAKRLVRKNIEVSQSLRSMQAKVRTALSELIERQHSLAPCAAAMLRYADSGEFADLSELSKEDVEKTLKAAKGDKSDSRNGERSRRVRAEGDSLALDLITEEGGKGLKAAAQRFRKAIEPDPEGQIESDDIQVGRRVILPRVKSGTSQATALFGRLLTADLWGGFILADGAPDFVSAQKLVESNDVELEPFCPEHEHQVRGILRRAVDRGIATADALKIWDEYAAVRAELLRYAQPLIDHPLLALAGEQRIAELSRLLVEKYSAALQVVEGTARDLDQRGSAEAAKRLIACALCLDVVFIWAADGLTAIAGPTHPFHLWRWNAFLSLLNDYQDEMQALGRDLLEPLVTDPPSVCPQIVLSPFALSHRLDRSRALIPIGTFAALPLFCEPSSRRSGPFRAAAVAAVAQRFVRLMPHASLAMRVALIDPPSLAGGIEELLDLIGPFGESVPVPLHAVVLRTQAPREETSEEEEAASTVARELMELGGALDVKPPLPNLQAVAEELSKAPVHLAVVFDPGVGERISVAVSQRPTLSPLVVPRAYRYDEFDDRLDMVIAGDAQPFGTYHELYCKSLGVPMSDFVGRRSGASQSSRSLEALARSCVWLLVVDQAVEPTIRISGTERLDWRSDAGRDVVTFTAHPEAIEDLIGDAITAAGLVPDEETRKRTLRELFMLSGEAVLGLAKPQPDASLASPRVAKGTLGVLTANRWYSEQHPDSLVISLDDPLSRQWILGAGSDDRHGDLLGVRAGGSGVILEALEVKAHEDPSAGVRYHNGTVEGRPVAQIDQTVAILKQVFAVPPSSPVVGARREILRDQLYRAVASRPYDSDRRGRYVRLLEELFSAGPSEIRGAVFRVAIEARASGSSTVEVKTGTSPYGNTVSVVDLTESGAAKAFSRLEVPGDQKRGQREKQTVLVERPKTDKFQERREEKASELSQGSAKRGEEKKVSPEVQTEKQGQDLRVLIGNSPSGEEVYWDPHQEDTPLNNFGFLVTGDSGSGKTQILKALVASAARRKLPTCIFDFKNDYSGGDDQFAERCGFQVYDIDRNGLPFNPLSLIADERGEAQPIRQVHELAGILGRIFKLGPQQEAKLKRAMVAAYEAHDIRAEARCKPAKITAVPGFNEVKGILEQDDKNDALLNRLSPLFDLNLFPEHGEVSLTFERLIAERVILDLHSLPDDRIKAAMSEFMIVRLHGYVLKGEQPRRLRRLLVLDEAWRVKDSTRLQELAREGRAFGVGIVLGTQFPGDIPENLSGNLATQLMLSNQDPEHRRVVVRTLCGTTSGADANRLLQQLMHLQKHWGFFRNQQYAPYCLVESLPYFKRAEGR